MKIITLNLTKVNLDKLNKYVGDKNYFSNLNYAIRTAIVMELLFEIKERQHKPSEPVPVEPLTEVNVNGKLYKIPKTTNVDNRQDSVEMSSLS